VNEWVLLAYRMPREPSTPRIAVWRKLERLGVARLLDGLVALPRDDRSQEQLEWLAEEITDAGGEATVWFGVPGSKAHQRDLAAAMTSGLADEYRELARSAAEAAKGPAANRRRTAVRLQRELHTIEGRDFFAPPERERARRAVQKLMSTVDALT
jgi:hypothetical protein